MGDAEVGEVLLALLDREEARVLWRPHERRHHDGVNRSAVAAAVAAHGGDFDRERRGMKDRVTDAINGRRTSAETVGLLCETFGWDDDRLRALLALRDLAGPQARHARDDLITAIPGGGSGGGPGGRPGGGTGGAGGRDYLVIAVHEFHHVGADGLPASNETVQTVRSQVPRLTATRYAYLEDEGNPTVTVVEGGTTVRVERRGDVVVNHIGLPRVLGEGDTASLRYRTDFAYAVAPAPDMRRTFPVGCALVEIRVSFEPGRLPRSIRRCRWPAPDAEPEAVERVHLDASHAVSSVWQEASDRLVGFAWDW